MRLEENDKLLWKQRREMADTLMIMSGYAKNMLSCHHSRHLGLTHLPSLVFTHVGANSRRLRAGSISPQWEEITGKSGRCVVDIYMQTWVNMHAPVQYANTRQTKALTDTWDATNPLNLLIWWVMTASAHLTHWHSQEKSFWITEIKRAAWQTVYLEVSSWERQLLLLLSRAAYRSIKSFPKQNKLQSTCQVSQRKLVSIAPEMIKCKMFKCWC